MPTSPTRVLHVLGAMNRGGAETWLMQVLRNVPRERIRMDFLVHTAKEAAFDSEIRDLGSSVIACPSTSRPLAYAREFLKALSDRPRYDAVHSHVHHFSGYVLGLARAVGVPIRIAHSHTDSSALDASATLVRRAYVLAMRNAIHGFATHGVAASDVAGRALFGKSWGTDPRWKVLHCGLDFSAFEVVVDREAIRAELGLPPTGLVVAHVGRFTREKNHSFLLHVARALHAEVPDSAVLMVGDGPLRAQIEAEARELGVSSFVRFAGVRTDVARLLGACDAFALPSIHEGLPLVALEAQAAGLPLIISNAVTRELAAVCELVTWLPLSLSAERWAATIVSAIRDASPSRADALRRIRDTDFDIRRTMRTLVELYGA
jgi:glycosyltransferase involved in cell wall biosynthesis